MSYLVLARKWRPQQFAEILGQDHVTRTLTNALTSGRIAHAFLFTGARGVGKTSAARILAKALCCQSSPGPVAAPCGTCSACVEIAEGRATDVFEIDAASNTGVGNVREIIDNVRYLPSKARFKIYIVDEVHMLSTGAFNALLKTLEEPPAHVKFILATTDVHKVPVTILSRCQRYDFRRIQTSAIAERLSEILHAEGIEHDPGALFLVARESEGSMRDSQSLLEQVLTYADGRPLAAPLVREALGVADRATLAEAVEAIAGRRPGKLLELVKEVHDRGQDIKRFGDALVEYVRDLLVARLLPDPRTVLDRPADELASLIERAKQLDPVVLERLFTELCRVVEEVGRSAYPRFTLEIGLAALAEEPVRMPIPELVQTLGRIEAALGGHGPARPPAAAPGGGAARPFPTPRLTPEAPPPPSVPVPVPAPAPEPRGPSGPQDFGAFVAKLRQRRPTLTGSLSQVRPLAFSPGKVELGCETKFDEETLGAPETRRYLESLLAEHFGRPTELKITRIGKSAASPPATAPAVSPASPTSPAPPAHAAPTAPTSPPGPALPQTLTEKEEDARRVKLDAQEEDAARRPAVKALADELGAKVVRVQIIEEP